MHGRQALAELVFALEALEQLPHAVQVAAELGEHLVGNAVRVQGAEAELHEAGGGEAEEETQAIDSETSGGRKAIEHLKEAPSSSSSNSI